MKINGGRACGDLVAEEETSVVTTTETTVAPPVEPPREPTKTTYTSSHCGSTVVPEEHDTPTGKPLEGSRLEAP